MEISSKTCSHCNGSQIPEINLSCEHAFCFNCLPLLFFQEVFSKGVKKGYFFEGEVRVFCLICYRGYANIAKLFEEFLAFSEEKHKKDENKKPAEENTHQNQSKSNEKTGFFGNFFKCSSKSTQTKAHQHLPIESFQEPKAFLERFLQPYESLKEKITKELLGQNENANDSGTLKQIGQRLAFIFHCFSAILKEIDRIPEAKLSLYRKIFNRSALAIDFKVNGLEIAKNTDIISKEGQEPQEILLDFYYNGNSYPSDPAKMLDSPGKTLCSNSATFQQADYYVIKDETYLIWLESEDGKSEIVRHNLNKNKKNSIKKVKGIINNFSIYPKDPYDNSRKFLLYCYTKGFAIHDLVEDKLVCEHALGFTFSRAILFQDKFNELNSNYKNIFYIFAQMQEGKGNFVIIQLHNTDSYEEIRQIPHPIDRPVMSNKMNYFHDYNSCKTWFFVSFHTAEMMTFDLQKNDWPNKFETLPCNNINFIFDVEDYELQHRRDRYSPSLICACNDVLFKYNLFTAKPLKKITMKKVQKVNDLCIWGENRNGLFLGTHYFYAGDSDSNLVYLEMTETKIKKQAKNVFFVLRVPLKNKWVLAAFGLHDIWLYGE